MKRRLFIASLVAAPAAVKAAVESDMIYYAVSPTIGRRRGWQSIDLATDRLTVEEMTWLWKNCLAKHYGVAT